ncbi:MAG: hypothetical protein LBS25_03125 [Candidatus Symbiothrix sp.]|jgi:hypothetical protein|nr:hypothetical protein [Candidatus Symbiothrix sp.]
MKKTVKNVLKRCLIFVLLVYGGQILSEEITAFPYFNGFENTGQDGEWTVVNGTSVNKWYIGSGTASQGNRGLYVSGDGGLTPSYQNTPCGIGVYKEIILPAGAQYRVSFDWKVQGERNLTSNVGLDTLLVYWVSDPTEPVYPNVTGDKPETLKNYRRQLETTESVKGGTFWNNSSFIVNGSPTTRRLLFYWINNNANNFYPAACIDNIQIEQIGVSSCSRPELTSMTYEDGVRLDWTGNSPEYRLKYYRYQSNTWTEVQETIQGSPYTVTGLEKGFYRFWLQGVCGTDTTAWTVSDNFIVGVSTGKCLNYVDLTNNKLVYPTHARPYENVNANTGIVDFGYESEKSQHTIHYIRESDPYTLDQLKTIPEDEVASVRLGNWIPDNSAESLTYTFTVNEATPVLLIKYAAVLHYWPGDYFEDYDQNPRFILRVMDMLGRPLDEQCLNVKIIPSPGVSGSGWHVIPEKVILPERSGDGSICWRDWTSIGMNLRKYAGRQLRIYLETGDCSPAPGLSGHFGYAYFTLDCVTDKLEGLTCGSAAEKIDTVWAPKGYKYEWYKITSPTVITSTERYFVPQAGDTATYKCRLTFAEIGKENCFFELTAALLPRYPVADASYTVCRRNVSFTDKSYVYTQNGKVDEQPDMYWTIEDTIIYDRNPAYEFPAPGSYKVSLHASINDGVCEDLWEEYITVSDDTIKTYIDKTLCPGTWYTFGERELTRPGVYVDSLTTAYGCDSIVILDLKYYNTTKRDTICAGQSYVFEGENVQLPEGLHELRYNNVKSVFGCDSILALCVLGELTVESAGEVCSGDAIVSFLLNGSAESVQVAFNEKSINAGLLNQSLSINGQTFDISIPSGVRPGYYGGKFIFNSNLCGVLERDFSFTALYPSDIIFQRWNNLLSLKNSAYNGGYTFGDYQWYKNGDVIPGATQSYFYAGEDLSLDFSASYNVEITRVDDGEKLFTCPFFPVKFDDGDITIKPSLLKKGQSVEIEVPESGVAELYNMMGLKITGIKLEKGGNGLNCPVSKGVYLLNIRLDGGRNKIFRISVND